jgi:hypothetical protein
LEALRHRQSLQLRRSLRLRVGRRDALEQLQEALQGVVCRLGGRRRSAPVVDHVEGDLALLLGDPSYGGNLGGVHDGGVQAGLDALMQED